MVASDQQGFNDFFLGRPASIEQLIDEMNVEIYDSLKLAVEIGKWNDGKRLDKEQVDFCMQAIILYEAKHLQEQDRVGFDLSSDCASKTKAAPTEPLTFVTGSGFAGEEGN